MRQFGCMSADVYCQKLIIIFTQHQSFYIQTERRGNGQAGGETERERVCERQRMARNKVGVCCKNGCWEKD
jgi:hypothetical protein